MAVGLGDYGDGGGARWLWWRLGEVVVMVLGDDDDDGDDDDNGDGQ